MASEINIESKKIELIQWLSTIEDVAILDKISALLTQERSKDCWKNTPIAEKNSIENGIKDADSGKVNPHAKAREIYGKRV